ncbi:MAG: glycosyltransferase family 2 protein [Candidatus Dormibacteraceae bacterium]
MNDDITVVITCFNYGAYLPEAVQSALQQQDGPPQVVVVDDGSADPETLAALENLPPGVDLIRQSNAGLSAARNTGLREARTPYVIVLDADDCLSRDALAVLRVPLDRDPRLGFSYGIARFFGAWEGTLVFPPYDPYKLLYRHIVGSTALMRREMFDEIGGYDPEFTAYEDWEFWLHGLACGWRGEGVEQVTFHYRRHGHSMYTDARAHYRLWFRRLRQKHAALYGRRTRRTLARESGLGPLGRAVYRWWWGARPIPARLEGMLHTLLWRPRTSETT